MTQNRKFASQFQVIAPAGRDCIPNVVREPPILTWVRWTRRSSAAQDVWGKVGIATFKFTIRHNPREHLVFTG